MSGNNQKKDDLVDPAKSNKKKDMPDVAKLHNSMVKAKDQHSDDPSVGDYGNVKKWQDMAKDKNKKLATLAEPDNDDDADDHDGTKTEEYQTADDMEDADKQVEDGADTAIDEDDDEEEAHDLVNRDEPEELTEEEEGILDNLSVPGSVIVEVHVPSDLTEDQWKYFQMGMASCLSAIDQHDGYAATSVVPYLGHDLLKARITHVNSTTKCMQECLKTTATSAATSGATPKVPTKTKPVPIRTKVVAPVVIAAPVKKTVHPPAVPRIAPIAVAAEVKMRSYIATIPNKSLHGPPAMIKFQVTDTPGIVHTEAVLKAGLIAHLSGMKSLLPIAMAHKMDQIAYRFS